VDWDDPPLAALAFRLDGEAFETAPGETPSDSSFLLLMNGERSPTAFVVPPIALGDLWRIVVDTRERPRVGDLARPGQKIDVDAGGLVVLTSAQEPSVAPPVTTAR
jgi:hypothetical protein